MDRPIVFPFTSTLDFPTTRKPGVVFKTLKSSFATLFFSRICVDFPGFRETALLLGPVASSSDETASSGESKEEEEEPETSSRVRGAPGAFGKP